MSSRLGRTVRRLAACRAETSMRFNLDRFLYLVDANYCTIHLRSFFDLVVERFFLVFVGFGVCTSRF